MGGDIGEIQLGSERELHKYTNHYAVVVTKASSKIILVQVYIIFALPDYSSSEVIEDNHTYTNNVSASTSPDIVRRFAFHVPVVVFIR